MWENITLEDCEKCPYRYNLDICLGEGCPPQQEKYRQRINFITSSIGKILFQTPFPFVLMIFFK